MPHWERLGDPSSRMARCGQNLPDARFAIWLPPSALRAAVAIDRVMRSVGRASLGGARAGGYAAPRGTPTGQPRSIHATSPPSHPLKDGSSHAVRA